MFAVKANRQYAITEDEKTKFISRGYKIARLVDGNIVIDKVETKETKQIKKLEEKIAELETALIAEKTKVKEKVENKKTQGEGK